MLRTSEAFLTMTKLPLAIVSWFPEAVAIVWGTTVCVGDVTAGWATAVVVVAAGGLLAICTKLPFMFSTKIETMS
jgi:hypothetical protein